MSIRLKNEDNDHRRKENKESINLCVELTCGFLESSFVKRDGNNVNVV